MPLAAIAHFDAAQFLDTLVSLGTAFVLGTLIGAERQYRQRTAGLRTNTLVAVGAAAFVDLGMRLTGQGGAIQIMAYVVSGVGFLGAGAIMKEGLNIRGLNTAATLWGSAAVGAAAGADQVAEAVLIAIFVLVGNTALRPLVNAINRQPMDEARTEATYEMHVTAGLLALPSVREALIDRLDQTNYAVRDVVADERADDAIDLTATLSASSADPGELDTIVGELRRLQGVQHASWSMRTSD